MLTLRVQRDKRTFHQSVNGLDVVQVVFGVLKLEKDENLNVFTYFLDLL